MNGERLKQLREGKNLKQEELANILSISTGAIGMYERNYREPNDELKIKMCNFFGCTMDYLMGIKGIRMDPLIIPLQVEEESIKKLEEVKKLLDDIKISYQEVKKIFK